MKVRISFSKSFYTLLSFSLLIVLCLSGCAQDSSILDNGGNRQIEFSVTKHNWSDSANSNKSSDQKVSSRATPITGNTFDTSNSFNLIADQNDGNGNYSTLIDNKAVSYSNNIWKTTKDYYWSGNSSKTINFYAYYPTSISSSISHTAGSAPTLSYTVPDNVTNQPDIIVASKENVAGNTMASTSLTFKHIFAAVQFSVGSSGLGSGTISSISIGDVYNSGTYTFGSGWTLGTSTKTFIISQPKTISGTSGEDIYSGTYTLMMIPQTVNSAMITVNYSNGGTLTKAISGTWEAGETYNYGLSFIREYNYTGNVQSFTAPVTGTYKLEVWGASGGSATYNTTAEGGKGGYSYGNLALTKDKILYISVGGTGANGTTMNTTLGGWNGGASRVGINVDHIVGGGGGCTSIQSSLIGDGQLKNYESVKDADVLIVAGGGGGGFWRNASGFVFSGIGGTGGGTNGGNGTSGWTETPQPWGSGGTQTSGGTNSYNEPGSFGMGGGDQNLHAGGGGGWYGGGAGYGGAGGGSGYIGGVSDGTMQNGVRYGNGYARITFISAN